MNKKFNLIKNNNYVKYTFIENINNDKDKENKTNKKGFFLKKETQKRIIVVLVLMIFIISSVFGGIYLAYENRNPVDVATAADYIGYICEDTTQFMDLNDNNAKIYLVGKNADTVNENFLQLIQFSTNTYASSYYKEQKSQINEIASLMEMEFTEKEDINNNNYRYTITFVNGQKFMLILEGKQMIYLSTKSININKNMMEIITMMKLEK